MAMVSSRAPRGLNAAGRKLWDAATSSYDLEAHELLLLENAARTADLIAGLQARIEVDGPVSAEGKTHSAVLEIRQQRITLARLLVALRCRAVMRMRVRSGAVSAGCTGWMVMRRREPVQRLGGEPARLMDASTWPLCARAGGGEQPCSCWFADRQSEWAATPGNEWPGGDVGLLRDYLAVIRVHECNAPFDPAHV